MGRTVATETTTKIAHATIEAEFSRRTSFAGLSLTDEGFTFDEIVVIRQANFDLNENGERTSPSRVEDRTLVVRHEYRQRRSTGRLEGWTRVVANSRVDTTGLASLARLQIDGDKLRITSTTMGYDDAFAKNGTYAPAAFETVSEYSLHDGRLRRVQSEVHFDVDPDSLVQKAKNETPQELIDDEAPQP